MTNVKTNEMETLEMLNVILDNIEVAERNNYSIDVLNVLYEAKDALVIELKALI